MIAALSVYMGGYSGLHYLIYGRALGGNESRAPAGTQSARSALGVTGALLCADQDAADAIVRALRDPDLETVVRRLVVMLTSEGCREILGSQRYDVAKVEPSGLLEIHLRRTAGYIVPLAPTEH